MLLRLRQFCFFFLVFMLINIVINVLYLVEEKTRNMRKYKYGRPVYVDIAQNVKILRNLIICYKNDTHDVKAVELKNDTNISNIMLQYNSSYEVDSGKLRACPVVPPDLGPVVNDQAVWSLLGVEDMYLWIQPGGIHLPTECVAQQQVAIIVPTREANRFQHVLNIEKRNGNLKLCPLLAPNLGPVADDKAIWSLFGVDNIYLRTQPGGIHIPTKCLALQYVAVVIPIHESPRIKSCHVSSFLFYIHPFLMKQQLEYQIFVILKSNATGPYKRGELFNIGFKEAQAYRPGGWDCIIFHDAHLVPLDTRNLYRCSQHPRMLIAGFQKTYKFGGAVAVRPRHFMKANGFSNNVWSNDGDYIDMYKRLIAANFTVESNVSPIGNYSYFEALRQENHEPETSQTNAPHYLKDGLSTVSYNIKNCLRLKQFYTLIEVEV